MLRKYNVLANKRSKQLPQASLFNTGTIQIANIPAMFAMYTMPHASKCGCGLHF